MRPAAAPYHYPRVDEETPTPEPAAGVAKGHPRVGGETLKPLFPEALYGGLSPRGRGNHWGQDIQASGSKRPFLMMNDADQALGPWNAKQSDMLADDWEVVE